LKPADIAWRCDQSLDFFLKCTANLREQTRFDAAVWKYALKWNDARCIGEWLSATGTIDKLVSAPFTCRWITVR
jgi:hypothetical protein